MVEGSTDSQKPTGKKGQGTGRSKAKTKPMDNPEEVPPHLNLQARAVP
jgi:hypothetical protein